MGKINWGRVVLGGLLVMILLGVFNAISIPLFRDAWNTALDEVGGGELVIEPTAGFLVTATALQFGVGIVAVWLYAAIRPRYGPGPMTAAIAGFALWLMASGGFSWFVIFTDFTFGSFVALHGPAVVALIVATNVGALVYKEGAAEAQAPPTASEVDSV